jgi:hypothetical protein
MIKEKFTKTTIFQYLIFMPKEKKTLKKAVLLGHHHHHWKTRELSPQQVRRDRLKQRIYELFVEHSRMAGSPIITADLNDEPSFPVSVKIQLPS